MSILKEAIKRLSDAKMDQIIKDKYEGFVDTYVYNANAVIELGKWMDDVLVTKDGQFFHINSRQSPALKKHVDAIIKKYSVKKVN